MKKLLFFLISLVPFQPWLCAQTNVSGGIFSNTTWSLANSPYIVVDTVVVFPGVTLTIEPGVVVKFTTDKLLEIRQGQLLAIGTANDSITFTSDSTSPFPGVWSKIHISGGSMISQFAYCNIFYATTGIFNNYFDGFQHWTVTLKINHSSFKHNFDGIHPAGNGGGFSELNTSEFRNNEHAVYGSQFKIDSCNIESNQTGVDIYPASNTYSYINHSKINDNQYGVTSSFAYGASFYSLKNSVVGCNSIAGIVLGQYSFITDTIYNCLIRENAVGVLDTSGNGLLMQKCILEGNDYGMRLKDSNKDITCNKFCNNVVYDIYCKNVFANNLSIPNNYWCTTDSTAISSRIYDGYDNFNLSLIFFIPVDSLQCYSMTVNNPVDTTCTTVVGINSPPSIFNNTIKVYPNPTTGIFTMQGATAPSLHGRVNEIQIFDLFGRLVLRSNEPQIDMSSYPAGLYVWQVGSERGKLILE